MKRSASGVNLEVKKKKTPTEFYRISVKFYKCGKMYSEDEPTKTFKSKEKADTYYLEMILKYFDAVYERSHDAYDLLHDYPEDIKFDEKGNYEIIDPKSEALYEIFDQMCDMQVDYKYKIHYKTISADDSE